MSELTPRRQNALYLIENAVRSVEHKLFSHLFNRLCRQAIRDHKMASNVKPPDRINLEAANMRLELKLFFDQLQCHLTLLGIDPTSQDARDREKRVHIFKGCVG